MVTVMKHMFFFFWCFYISQQELQQVATHQLLSVGLNLGGLVYIGRDVPHQTRMWVNISTVIAIFKHEMFD